MSETLQVEVRQNLGSRASRKLRQAGRVPAVLYGHGEESVSLALCADELGAALRHGQKLLELQGGISEKAVIHDLQWDTYSQYVLHVDLVRVRAGERVVMEVPIETRGQAPGEKMGGVVELVQHSLEMEVSVMAIPEHITVNINELGLNETIVVSDLTDLPEGAKVLTEDHLPVVQCIEPVEAPEEEDESLATAGTEPELVGGKKEDDEEESAASE